MVREKLVGPSECDDRSTKSKVHEKRQPLDNYEQTIPCPGRPAHRRDRISHFRLFRDLFYYFQIIFRERYFMAEVFKTK